MIQLTRNKRNPGDAFKRQDESWRRAYAQAPSLGERFPGVLQLVTEISFIDARGLGRYSAQTRTLSPSAKALFALPCPRTLCLDGGFDLDAVVARLIAAGEIAAAGTLECGGRIGPGHSCLLRLDYSILIEYGTVAAHPDQPAP